MLERLKEICCEYSEVDKSTLSEVSDLRSDLNLNSLELANMLVAIEDEFGIEISDRDAMGFITLGDVVNYISDKLS